MAVLIGHACSDENGNAKNGKAGDQTGREVRTQNYYNGDWEFVIRFTDPKMAERAAKECEAACKNNAIGYDQTQRNTLLAEARKVNFNLSKITVKCECDCSALVSVCAIAAGVPEKSLFISNNLPRTGTMKATFSKVNGVKILTDKKYLTSDKYLKRGDIVVKANRHTIMILSNGSAVQTTTTTTKAPASTTSGSYLVRITADALNIRKGPGTLYKKVGCITDKGVYTIVKEKKNGTTVWGLLKSGAANEDKWISLKYTKKI